MRRITSRDNPLIRELVDLAHSSRARRRAGRTVLEGIHLCEAYLARFGEPPAAIVTDEALAHPEVSALLDRSGLEPTIVPAALFDAVSTLGTGIGIAFMIDIPAPPLPARIDNDTVYLDRVQDPGNVGTILRTCAAAGIGSVVTAPGTAACWAPKVLRAAMGAHFHLAIHETVPWPVVGERLAIAVHGTRATLATSIHDADLRSPCLWLFGNEGKGLAEDIERDVGHWLRIPQRPGVESLNVGAAVAVCLFEQVRQRSR
jgi:RNA methyltransferase, TrmH family